MALDTHTGSTDTEPSTTEVSLHSSGSSIPCQKRRGHKHQRGGPCEDTQDWVHFQKGSLRTSLPTPDLQPPTSRTERKKCLPFNLPSVALRCGQPPPKLTRTGKAILEAPSIYNFFQIKLKCNQFIIHPVSTQEDPKWTFPTHQQQHQFLSAHSCIL